MTLGLRLIGGLAAAIALVGPAAAASAPKVQGKYTGLSYHLCQTVFRAPTITVDKNNGMSNTTVVKAFGSDWNAGPNLAGMLSVDLSTVTFPNKAGASGNVTFSSIEVVGHNSRYPDSNVPTDSSGFSRIVHGAQQDTFSLTATTATLGDITYDMGFGNVDADGVAGTINLVRKPNGNDSKEYCIDAMTLTRQ